MWWMPCSFLPPSAIFMEIPDIPAWIYRIAKRKISMLSIVADGGLKNMPYVANPDIANCLNTLSIISSIPNEIARENASPPVIPYMTPVKVFTGLTVS